MRKAQSDTARFEDLFFGAPKLDLLHHTNPLYRIAPRVHVGESGDFQYNREKYRDMLFESAETVLSIFGFNRTAYGDKPKKNKKWWRRLKDERLRDRDAEKVY